MTHRTIASCVALALLVACGSEAPTSPDAADASAARASSRQASDVPAGDTPQGVENGRITLRADGVKRSALLARIARLAGFQLLGVPVDDRILSIDRENAPIEAVLVEVLIGEPYALRYAIDEETGGHRLERVTVGSFESELARLRREERLARKRRADEKRAEERQARGKGNRRLTPEEREERAAERALERDEHEREIEDALAASDPRDRARGVRKLDADEGDLPRLLEFASDPDPEIRAAAASQLAFSDSRAATDALYAALDDPEPQVVMDALDGIAFKQDPSAIPLILPLLDHPDERIRDFATQTLETLE